MSRVDAGAAIVFDHVDKDFRAFRSPLHRLLEALHPRGAVYHRPVSVLRDVSFVVPRGQTVAVLGANGAGKSTILHLAAGLLAPSRGRVTTSGRLVGVHDLSNGFDPELTGRQNVRFFHEVVLDGAGDRLARERAVADFADLGEHFDRPVRTYSTGMVLRLAFANAMSIEPDILLVDEVIAVGDAAFQHKCYTRLRTLGQRGTTVVLVTHAAEVVPGLCDRALVLDGGRIVFDGHPAVGVARYYALMLAAPERPPRTAPDAARTAPRYGVGGATITRCYASADGQHVEHRFRRHERVTVVMDVLFDQAVLAPHFGFSCATSQGLQLYGATTLTQVEPPAAACAGEQRRVEIAFDLTVGVPDVFISLSVLAMVDGTLHVLDGDSAALHLRVTAATSGQGLVDLGAAFSERVLVAA